MITPQLLRQNGWDKILSAETLLASDQFDSASYLVGYAVEFALKARFCTRNSLPHFPSDYSQAKALGKGNPFIHDLDKLLTLSDDESIKQSSLMSIDWGRAMDWTVEKRYEPVGSVSREQVTTQINETKKLFFELALFEIVEKMAALEIRLSSEMGPFCLFLVGNRVTQREGWEVLMSAWWLDSQSKLDAIRNQGGPMLDSDLAATIKNWGCRSPDDDVVDRFNSLPRFEHQVRCAVSHNFVIDRILPPAYVITNCRRPNPDVVTP